MRRSNASSQYHAIVRQLLQKSDLSGGGSDRGLIVLAHLFFDESRDDFLRCLDTRQVHVKIVNVEEDDATAIQWHRAFEIDSGGAARGGELALFVAAGRDQFETPRIARGLPSMRNSKLSLVRPLTKRPCLSKTITSVWTSSV